MKRILGVAVAVVVLTAAASGARAVSIVLPRAGQIGVGLQGQYGSFFDTGELGEEFGAGAGLAVRLRYRMRFERAMGLSFESENLSARTPDTLQTAFLASLDGLRRETLKMTSATFDLYQFFGTRTRTPKYLSASLGVGQVSSQLQDGETQYPINGGDAFILGVGTGLERFVYHSWAVDASLRYKAVLMDGQVNHDVQAAVGMMFYAAY